MTVKELRESLHRIDAKKEKLNQYRPLPPALAQNLED
jgi:hypothetical protein